MNEEKYSEENIPGSDEIPEKNEQVSEPVIDNNAENETVDDKQDPEQNEKQYENDKDSIEKESPEEQNREAVDRSSNKAGSFFKNLFNKIKIFFEKVVRAIISLPAAIINSINAKSLERTSNAVGKEEAQKQLHKTDAEYRNYENRQNAVKYCDHVNSMSKATIATNLEGRSPESDEIVKLKCTVADLGSRSPALYQIDIQLGNGDKYTTYADKDFKLLDNVICPDEVKIQLNNIMDDCRFNVYDDPRNMPRDDDERPEEDGEPIDIDIDEIENNKESDAEKQKEEEKDHILLNNGTVIIMPDKFTPELATQLNKDMQSAGPASMSPSQIASVVNKTVQWYESKYKDFTQAYLVSNGMLCKINIAPEKYDLTVTHLESGRKLYSEIPRNDPNWSFRNTVKVLTEAVGSEKKYEAIINGGSKENNKESFSNIPKGIIICPDKTTLVVTDPNIDIENVVTRNVALLNTLQITTRDDQIEKIAAVINEYKNGFYDENVQQDHIRIVSGDIIATYDGNSIAFEGMYSNAEPVIIDYDNTDPDIDIIAKSVEEGVSELNDRIEAMNELELTENTGYDVEDIYEQQQSDEVTEDELNNYEELYHKYDEER